MYAFMFASSGDAAVAGVFVAVFVCATKAALEVRQMTRKTAITIARTVIVLIFPRGTRLRICGGQEVRSAGANRGNSTPGTQIESSFPLVDVSDQSFFALWYSAARGLCGFRSRQSHNLIWESTNMAMRKEPDGSDLETARQLPIQTMHSDQSGVGPVVPEPIPCNIRIYRLH